jgi:hypothetical protein
MFVCDPNKIKVPTEEHSQWFLTWYEEQSEAVSFNLRLCMDECQTAEVIVVISNQKPG